MTESELESFEIKMIIILIGIFLNVPGKFMVILVPEFNILQAGTKKYV